MNKHSMYQAHSVSDTGQRTKKWNEALVAE